MKEIEILKKIDIPTIDETNDTVLINKSISGMDETNDIFKENGFWDKLKDYQYVFKDKEQKNSYLVVILMAIFSKIMIVGSSLMISYIVNSVNKNNGINFYMIGVFLLSYFLLKTGGHIVGLWFERKIAKQFMELSQIILNKYFQHYLRGFGIDIKNQVILSEIFRFKTSLYNFYMFLFKHIIPVLLEFAVAIVFMLFVLGWKYSVVTLFWVVLTVVVNIMINEKTTGIVVERDRNFDKSQEITDDILKNREKIIYKNKAELESKKFNDYSFKFIEEYLKFNLIMQFGDFFRLFILTLALTSLIGMNIYDIYVGAANGSSLAFLALTIGQVFTPFANLGYAFAALSNLKPQIRQIIEGVKKEYSYVEAQKDKVDLNIKSNIKIKINDLVMTLVKNNEKIFNDLNLEINQGETVAIVGKNGQGKSTLLKTMLGIEMKDFIVNKGDIKWVAQDVSGKKKLKGNEIFYNTVYIQQKEHIFQDTFLYNILYGLFDSRDELVSIYEKNKVLIDELIKETKVDQIIAKHEIEIISNEYLMESNFSGGEIQKIKFLNALINIEVLDKPVIFLDEPASAIDRGAEFELFEKALFNRNKKRTIIVITHNVDQEFLNLYDKVYVLKNKKVVLQER